MTISEWLVDAMVKLKDAGVLNGRTDALVLLCDEFEVDKSWVHSNPEKIIDDQALSRLNSNLNKRLNRIPLAYIRGFIEFYGRKFNVNDKVLIPRPETESFIELLKDLSLDNPKIADIGAGSGCIGITATLELPHSTVHLYDIDKSALIIADSNAKSLEANVQSYISDLLENLKTSYDVLLANLPYVPEQLVTSPEITKEPALALFSGKDGLDHYKKFWLQVKNLQNKPTYILTESLKEQHTELNKLAQAAGYSHSKTDLLVSVYAKD